MMRARWNRPAQGMGSGMERTQAVFGAGCGEGRADGMGDEMADNGQRCPLCGCDAAYLYRRGEEIVGCSCCVVMMEWYEVPERA